jgi:hypothetical protein
MPKLAKLICILAAVLLIPALSANSLAQQEGTPKEPDSSCPEDVESQYSRATQELRAFFPEVAAEILEEIRADSTYSSLQYDCKIKILSLLVRCYEELKDAEQDATIEQLIREILRLDMGFDFEGAFDDSAILTVAEKVRDSLAVADSASEEQSFTIASPGVLDFSLILDGVDLVLDGEPLGTTPLSPTEVEPGTHSLLLRKKYFDTAGRDTSLVVRRGERVIPNLSITPKSRGTAFQRSLLFPGLGQFYSEKPTKGVAFVAAELASLAFLAYAISDYKTKDDEYSSLLRDYSEAVTYDAEERLWGELQSSWSSLEKSSDRVNISMILPLVVYVANLLDAVIYGGAPQSAIEEYKEHQNRIGTNAETYGIYFTIGF